MESTYLLIIHYAIDLQVAFNRYRKFKHLIDFFQQLIPWQLVNLILCNMVYRKLTSCIIVRERLNETGRSCLKTPASRAST